MWKVILAYSNKERRIISDTFEYENYHDAVYYMLDWVMWACDEQLDAHVLLVDPTGENATAYNIKGGKII